MFFLFFFSCLDVFRVAWNNLIWPVIWRIRWQDVRFSRSGSEENSPDGKTHSLKGRDETRLVSDVLHFALRQRFGGELWPVSQTNKKTSLISLVLKSADYPEVIISTNICNSVRIFCNTFLFQSKNFPRQFPDALSNGESPKSISASLIQCNSESFWSFLAF